MKKTFVRIIAAVLFIAVLLPAAVSCSTNNQAVMKSDGDKNIISLAMYSLIASLMKGSVAYYVRQNYGDYNSSNFWDAVINGDTQITYKEYYTTVIQDKAKYYLAALSLFDELGLSLADNEIASIDEEMADFVKNDGDNSKSTFNAILAKYGFNYDTLREYKIFNAKLKKLSDSLYGGGDKIADNVKQEYFENHYVGFKQIMIPTYRYVYVRDENGDDIYYRIDSNGNPVYYERPNGEKSPRIAYDSENGIRLSVGDTYNKDSNGDEIYYLVDANGDYIYHETADGKKTPRKAYNTVAGKRQAVYENGAQKTESMSSEELRQIKDNVEQIETLIKKGDYDYFDDLITLYDKSYGTETGESSTQMTYLDKDLVYTNFSNGGALIDTFAEMVSELSAGEYKVYKSDYGYHIIMRYELERGAFSKSEYSTQFVDSNGNFDFNKNLCSELLMKRLAPYVEKVKVDKALADKVDISTIKPNYNFY